MSEFSIPGHPVVSLTGFGQLEMQYHEGWVSVETRHVTASLAPGDDGVNGSSHADEQNEQDREYRHHDLHGERARIQVRLSSPELYKEELLEAESTGSSVPFERCNRS